MVLFCAFGVNRWHPAALVIGGPLGDVCHISWLMPSWWSWAIPLMHVHPALGSIPQQVYGLYLIYLLCFPTPAPVSRSGNVYILQNQRAPWPHLCLAIHCSAIICRVDTSFCYGSIRLKSSGPDLTGGGEEWSTVVTCSDFTKNPPYKQHSSFGFGKMRFYYDCNLLKNISA